MSWNQQQDWNPQQPGGPSPYSDYPAQPGYPHAHGQPPRKSSKLWLWILLGGGGMMFLCCGGCGVLAYIGLSQQSSDVQAKFQDHPAVREHIGEIQSVRYNWTKSGEIDDFDTMVYDVEGSKGSGRFIVKEEGDPFDGDLIIDFAELELDDGRKFQLHP